MFSLKINGKPAVLKKGTSVKLTRENPFFTGSGTYSLDVSLPLDGCRENQSIFGAIHRPENPKLGTTAQKFTFHLLAPPLDLQGRAVVTQVSRSEVKVQLLADNSETKYDLIDERGGEVYIDSLDLGRAWEEVPEIAAIYAQYDSLPENLDNFNSMNYAVMSALNKLPEGGHHYIHGSQSQTSSVAFPVYSREEKKRANSHDIREYTPGGGIYKFGFKAPPNEDVSEGHIAAQPYLCEIVERILTALGYVVKRNDLKKTWFKDIFIANSKNCVKLAHALPHWTANDFFEELRNFTGHWLNFFGKEVEICSPKYLTLSSSPIHLQEIADEYECDVDEDNNSKSIFSSNIDYKWEPIDNWLRLSDEVWSSAKKVYLPNFSTNFENVNQLIPESERSSSKWLFISENDKKVVAYIKDGSGKYYPREVDQCPPLIRVGEQYGNQNRQIDITLRIVPAQTILTKVDAFYGGTKNDSYLPTLSTQQDRQMRMTPVFNVSDFIQGESNNQEETIKDIMEVAINTSDYYLDSDYTRLTIPMAVGNGWYKNPPEGWQGSAYYEKIELVGGTFQEQFKLTNPRSPSIGADVLEFTAQINMKSEVCFDFLDKKNLSPLNIFHIKGRRYACSKIEFTITEEGIQPLKRGYFYELK